MNLHRRLLLAALGLAPIGSLLAQSKPEAGFDAFNPAWPAQLVTFLASPGAQGVTGQIIRDCGGALIGA